MARVKLLRQSLEDYNKKAQAVNAQTTEANAEYDTSYGQYAAGVDQYNKAIAAVPFVVSAPKNKDYVQLSTGEVINPLDPIFWEQMGGKPAVGTFLRGGKFTTDSGVGPAPTAPTPPTAPDAPRAPNLTQGDIRELSNPSVDQVGMQMLANKGIIGKNELAGMDQSKISAFADPEDPHNLKEAGILARTLGGQL